MPAVTVYRRRRPSAFWRILTLLTLLGQVVTASAAWLDVSTGGRDQWTHVEDAGTRLHYVHDDGACALCALAQLGGVPGQLRGTPGESDRRSVPPRLRRSAAVVAEYETKDRSRAPPLEG